MIGKSLPHSQDGAVFYVYCQSNAALHCRSDTDGWKCWAVKGAVCCGAGCRPATPSALCCLTAMPSRSQPSPWRVSDAPPPI